MAPHNDPKWASLIKRLGHDHVARRLKIQREHSAAFFWKSRTSFHVENAYGLKPLLINGLKGLFLYQRGYRNYLALQVRTHRINIDDLPPALEGYTLLHLSDLHLDLDPRLTDVLADILPRLAYDLCVITGDFRARTYGDYTSCLKLLERLRRAIHRPVYAILGNHDTLEMIDHMESLGYPLLINETTLIRHGDSVFSLAGVDDPHFYMTDNLPRVAAQTRKDKVSILLSHTPEVYREAEMLGFHVMLCGHTHGGQICLPGGIPIICNARCPRSFIRGPWRYKTLKGYTSVGTGSSGVPIRFWCQPEIVLHTFHRSRRR